MASRARQGLTTLGDQSILFAAAMRGIFQRPFYLAEFLDQCKFILTSCFVLLMLTGLGAVTSGANITNFFTQGTMQTLYGGEMTCVIFGMLIATSCCYKSITARGGAEGAARAVHQGVVACFVSIQSFVYLYTPTVLAL